MGRCATTDHRPIAVGALAAILLLAATGCEPSRRDYLDQARRVLPRALASDMPGVQALALEAYRDLEQPAPADELRRLVRHEAASIRFTAVMAAGAADGRFSREFFESVYRRDDDPSVRLAAVYGLARRGDARRMGTLAAGLRHRDPVVRRNAALVLGRLGDASAVGMLREHLRDPDTGVQLNVAEAMARLGDDRGLPVIRRMLGEPRSRYHLYAILALGRVGEPGKDIPLLRQVATGEQAHAVESRLASLGARAMLGDYTQMSVLLEALGPEAERQGAFEPAERALVLQMLARAAYGPAWREVGRLLDARNPYVQTSAAWAMLSFHTPRAEEVIERIEDPSATPSRLTQEEVLRRPKPDRDHEGEDSQTEVYQLPPRR